MSILTWQNGLDLAHDCLLAVPHILSSLGFNQLTPEFLDHCFEFLIAARIYDDILFAKLMDTLSQFFVALQHLLAALFALLFFFGVLIAKLSIVAFPYIYELSKTVYDFHTKNFSQRDIMIEVVFVTAALLIFVFRHRLRLQWKRFEQSLTKSSKTIALCAPHLLYVLVAAVIVVFAQKLLKTLISLNVLSVVTLLAPVISTFMCILRYYRHQGPLLQRQASSVRQSHKMALDFQEERELLTLWVVLSCYHAVTAIVSSLPLSTWILHRLPYILEFVLISMIWLQLSPSFCHFVYTHFSLALLHGVVRRVPLADLSHSPQLDYALRSLRYTGVVSEFVCDLFRGLLQDSLTFLLILGFLGTPSFITHYGVVLVAIVLPAYKSSLALAACTDAVLAGVKLNINIVNAALTITDADTANDSPGNTTITATATTADTDTITGDVSTSITPVKSDRIAASDSSTPISSSVSVIAATTSSLAALLLSPFRTPTLAATRSLRRQEEETRQRQQQADDDVKLRALSMWVDYWACFGLLWLLKLFVLRHVWPSVLLLTAGYLQHAYFTGCTEVVQILLPWISQGPWGWLWARWQTRKKFTSSALPAAPPPALVADAMREGVEGRQTEKHTSNNNNIHTNVTGTTQRRKEKKKRDEKEDKDAVRGEREEEEDEDMISVCGNAAVATAAVTPAVSDGDVGASAVAVAAPDIALSPSATASSPGTRSAIPEEQQE